jgi:hypothetical protein
MDREVLQQPVGLRLGVEAERFGQIAEGLPHLALLAQHVEVAEGDRPSSGSCSVAMIRIRVDFPAPFRPSSPNIPFGTSSETSLSARVPLG